MLFKFHMRTYHPIGSTKRFSPQSFQLGTGQWYQSERKFYSVLELTSNVKWLCQRQSNAFESNSSIFRSESVEVSDVRFPTGVFCSYSYNTHLRIFTRTHKNIYALFWWCVAIHLCLQILLCDFITLPSLAILKCF